MSIRSTVTAFGTALALAVTLTATVAPAFGETLIFEQTGGSSISILEPVQQVQPKTPPKPQGQDNGFEFKPDVRVAYKDQILTGASIKYRFRVENVGIGTASNVALTDKVYQLPNGGAVNTVQNGTGGTIPSLATGESRDVTVTCLPLTNHSCYGAYLHAIVAHDLSPANNHASS